MRKNMIVLATLFFLVTACLPVQDQQELESRVNTAVAQTMEANNQIANAVAATVSAQSPLSTPTAATDPILTPTETPLAFPTFTFTPIVILISPTSTRQVSRQAEYACGVINRRPFDNSEFHKGDKFDVKWTIVNIGTKTWAKGVDVKYYSGTQLTNYKRVEIPKIMNPNDTYTIVMDATAPDTKGRHVMTWAVDGPMCYPYTAIVVK